MIEYKQVIYVSSLADKMSQIELDTLADLSAVKNKPLDITGVLAKVGDHFIQIIEGPSANVDALLEAITKDTRHNGLRIVYDEPIDFLTFDKWNMAATDLDKHYDFPLSAYCTLREKVYEIIERNGPGKFTMMEVIAAFRQLLCLQEAS
jgi:hypothetical protein